ncbi:MAG: hypothetical protein MUE74_12840 [Bacteroidales bacterium]|jgi:hypothetical protein|nr:hypothetical protein [Bacteroidales bacterium]
MKRKIFLKTAFLLSTSLIFVTCTKSDIEKAREAYDASKVVPIVQGISGPASVLQTFAYTYKLTYDRAGSTWEWTGVDCTIQSVSEDKKSATVLFNVLPASGKAKVQVAETTVGGATSPVKAFEPTVNPFCPLPVTGFVGAWSGTDGFNSGTHLQASQVVMANPSGTTIKVTGLNYGWIANKWGETVTDGGTINMTINANGTVVIPYQYCFTTDYDGSPYEYWVEGDGNWGNCGADPTLVINYVLTNITDGYDLPSEYYAFDNFTATLTLSGKKGTVSTPEKAVLSAEEVAAIKAFKMKR